LEQCLIYNGLLKYIIKICKNTNREINSKNIKEKISIFGCHLFPLINEIYEIISDWSDNTWNYIKSEQIYIPIFLIDQNNKAIKIKISLFGKIKYFGLFSDNIKESKNYLQKLIKGLINVTNFNDKSLKNNKKL
jgi:hypothetical protein